MWARRQLGIPCHYDVGQTGLNPTPDPLEKSSTLLTMFSWALLLHSDSFTIHLCSPLKLHLFPWFPLNTVTWSPPKTQLLLKVLKRQSYSPVMYTSYKWTLVIPVLQNLSGAPPHCSLILPFCCISSSSLLGLGGRGKKSKFPSFLKHSDSSYFSLCSSFRGLLSPTKWPMMYYFLKDIFLPLLR